MRGMLVTTCKGELANHSSPGTARDGVVLMIMVMNC